MKRKAGRFISVLLAILLVGVERADAQVAGEDSVRAMLHRVLEVRSSDSLDVTRTYSRAFFPDATFYRSDYPVGGAIDAAIRAAAVVVTTKDTVLVRQPADLSQVWQVAGAPLRLEPYQLAAACTELLRHTGLIEMTARQITDPDEIPAAQRRRLRPAGVLKRVRDGTESVMPDGAVEVRRYLWDNDLRMVRCRLGSDSEFTVEVVTLAEGRRNRP